MTESQMRSQFFPRSYGLSLATLLLTGFGTAPILGQSIPERHPNVLSLGTVTVLGSVTCPNGATKGATCTSVNVACPGIPDLTATLGEALPTGTPKGTIILHSGSGRPPLFNTPLSSPSLTS